MEITTLVLAALILLGASMVQAVAGFAFNLIAIPLLIWSGLSLPQSIAITAIPIFVQLSVSGYKLRDAVVWHDLKLPILIRYLTLPIGVTLLYSLSHLDTTTVKQVVGGILLLIVIVQTRVRFKPREHLPRTWDLIAFSLSGIMLGMVGMGGPPVVVWLMAHHWSARRSRAFVTLLFWVAAPVQIALLWWKLGDQVAEAFGWGLAATPLVIIATLIGVRIGDRFDREKLRRLILGLLFLTAVVSIVTPYL